MSERLLRIQYFMKEVLTNDKIVSIVLNINVEAGEDCDLLKIKVDQFQSMMSNLYIKNDNWTPSIKLIID